MESWLREKTTDDTGLKSGASIHWLCDLRQLAKLSASVSLLHREGGCHGHSCPVGIRKVAHRGCLVFV